MMNGFDLCVRKRHWGWRMPKFSKLESRQPVKHECIEYPVLGYVFSFGMHMNQNMSNETYVNQNWSNTPPELKTANPGVIAVA